MLAVVTGSVAFGVSLLLGVEPALGFLFALGVTVALVPEGLLPTVTLSLARAAQLMATNHSLVRRLEAVETLGSATFVCTDKTGTLTRNEMNVVRVWTPAGALDVAGEGYAPTATCTGSDPALEAARSLAASAVECVRGRVEQKDGTWRPGGDPMGGRRPRPRAAARRRGRRPRRRRPSLPRRRGAAALGRRVGGWIHVVGAPDSLLRDCVGSQEVLAAARAEVDRLSVAGRRVLGVARRRLVAPDHPEAPGTGQSDLSLRGIRLLLVAVGVETVFLLVVLGWPAIARLLGDAFPTGRARGR